MTFTVDRREAALELVRKERQRQIKLHGTNTYTPLGFGGIVNPPWLLPYSISNSTDIEKAFRAEYERYERDHGEVTWMHLIREEVAELFDTRCTEDAIDEAIQVAALCISLVENLGHRYEMMMAKNPHRKSVKK